MCGSKLQSGLTIYTQTKDTFLKLLLGKICDSDEASGEYLLLTVENEILV